MTDTVALHLSIGEDIPARRMGSRHWSGSVQLYRKPVPFEVSESAVEDLARRNGPLLIDLELYFSCLVRKQVRFTEPAGGAAATDGYTEVLPGLWARFRAVTTKECRRADVGDKPPVAEMPVKDPARFVPHEVRIDYRAGMWRGEYGIGRPD